MNPRASAIAAKRDYRRAVTDALRLLAWLGQRHPEAEWMAARVNTALTHAIAEEAWFTSWAREQPGPLCLEPGCPVCGAVAEHLAADSSTE